MCGVGVQQEGPWQEAPNHALHLTTMPPLTVPQVLKMAHNPALPAAQLESLRLATRLRSLSMHATRDGDGELPEAICQLSALTHLDCSQPQMSCDLGTWRCARHVSRSAICLAARCGAVCCRQAEAALRCPLRAEGSRRAHGRATCNAWTLMDYGCLRGTWIPATANLRCR